MGYPYFTAPAVVAFFMASLFSVPELSAESAGEKMQSPFSAPMEKDKLWGDIERTLGAPVRRGAAHGAKDPHASLALDQVIQVALQHHAKGRLPQALEALGKGLLRFPNDSRILSVRASILLQEGRTADALRDLETAANVAPNDPAIFVNRAQAYRRFGEKSKALADLDRAIELNPDYVAARFNRGSMHFDARRFKKALADFEVCIATDPHAAPPYFNLAMTQEQLGDKKNAIDHLKRFLELAKAKNWRELAEKKLTQLSGTPATKSGQIKSGLK